MLKLRFKHFFLIILTIDIITIALALILAVSIEGIQKPTAFTGEDSPFTFISFMQLVGTSYIAYQVFLHRKTETVVKGIEFFKNTFAIWFVISIGFMFLSFDEAVRIHEKLDWFTNWTLRHFDVTAIKKHDDISIFLYGGIGLSVLYYYKKEFMQFKPALIFFALGFICIFSSATLDMLGHRVKFFLNFIPEKETCRLICTWCRAVEECFKIFAGGMFLTGMYYCLNLAKRMKQVVLK